MNILKITQCKNGYVLDLEDEQGRPLDRRIASNQNERGYGESDLATAIISVFKDNTPKMPAPTPVPVPASTSINLDSWGLPSTLSVVEIPTVADPQEYAVTSKE